VHPLIREQIAGILPDLVFKAAHIYLRGKSEEEVVDAVQSKIDLKFRGNETEAEQQQLRKEIREMISMEYRRRNRP
jgi:hypothetical protein